MNVQQGSRFSFRRLWRCRAMLCAALLILSSGGIRSQEPGQPSSPRELLSRQAAQFPEKLIEVAENVYTAVGYSVSNSSMIVGRDGVIIVDTGMDIPQAQRIAEVFRAISDKPVKAIIFTHSHGDHTGGASVFLGDERPQIWAHVNFGSEARPLNEAGVTFQKVRGARQAGFRLPPKDRINNGIAPVRYPKRGGAVFATAREMSPTHSLDGDSADIEISGVKMQLIASPGETNDQMSVWLPEQGVLFSGDNFYRSFPNLYAIRGTPQRSVKAWADSLSELLSLEARVLVGGHTLPVQGRSKVKALLTDYRDAIRFVHDKTVEGMNKGLTPDELVEYVQLPERLREKDYLQPFYGHAQWGVRSVFNGYFGWFDGNATNLFRMTGREEAVRVAALCGGRDELYQAAEKALADDDPQWAAQLADYLLQLNEQSKRALTLKANALSDLAEDTLTATARNYYLTVAAELRSAVKNGE